MSINPYPTIEEQFINHLSHGNFTEVEAMLDDNGKFEIQDEQLESVNVNKKPFLEWWQVKWNERGWADVPEPEMEIDVDTCADCDKGCKVFFLDYGNFPYEAGKSGGDYVLHALLLKELNGRITSVKACSKFENKHNPMRVEILQSRVNDIMAEEKCNYMTAYITARVEMFGKHSIEIDSDFLMLCDAIDRKIKNGEL